MFTPPRRFQGYAGTMSIKTAKAAGWGVGYSYKPMAQCRLPAAGRYQNYAYLAGEIYTLRVKTTQVVFNLMYRNFKDYSSRITRTKIIFFETKVVWSSA